MSKRAGSKKKAKKKGKSNRVSLRDQLRASKSGQHIADSEQCSDPIGALNSEWWKNAKEADKWKDKWECMQTLMGFCCGDSFGKGEMPPKFDDNNKAGEVITIFAKWLNDEKHIFTRQHILKLLIPFSQSFSKSHWKKANKLAEGLILNQWSEKKHGFLPLVTPALIAVYIASGSQLKKWKEHLIQSMDSPQSQVRMSCWDFLAKICILSKQSGSKLKTRGPKDVEMFINEMRIIHQLKNTIINDKEKDVRASCAKFIFGAKQICNKVNILDEAYKEILNDKRASTALDMAADLFNNDKAVLSGGKADHEAITKKVEKKQQQQKKKHASSRMNNMRAMIAKAKEDSSKGGGGGAIQVAANNTKHTTNKTEKTDKNKGIKALMNKYKKKDDDDEDEDEDEDTHSDDEDEDAGDDETMSDHDDDKSDESSDSSTLRDREREKKKKEREKIRKERERERERKRKEKEKERARKKKEKEKEDDKKRNKKRNRYRESASESESESESSSEERGSQRNEKKRGKTREARGRNKASMRNGKKSRDVKQSKTQNVDESQNSAKGYDKASLDEIKALSKTVENISFNVESLQDGMNGMERRIGDLAKTSQSKSGISTKAEEKIMKILGQLQKDVKIMKNDISYIKACWEDAESVPSDAGY